MTVGRRQYNEAEMLQMQREAEVRVREMQARARKAAADTPEVAFTPQNRNWSNNPGMFRQRNNRRPMQQQGGRYPNAPQPPPKPEPEKAPEPDEKAEAVPDTPPAAPEPAPKKSGTVVGDIMEALGLDEDYLLIIGLLLILINQRADTTLILALAYLLI